MKKHFKNERACRDIKTEKPQKHGWDGTLVNRSGNYLHVHVHILLNCSLCSALSHYISKKMWNSFYGLNILMIAFPGFNVHVYTHMYIYIYVCLCHIHVCIVYVG